MNYNFNICAYPKVCTFYPLKTQATLVATIAEQKRVQILVSMKSKTCVNVMVNADGAEFQASYIPAGCKRLRFHHSVKSDMWSGNHNDCYMFKVLKSQKWNEFKYYLGCLMDSLNIPCASTETIDVDVCLNYEAKAKLEVPECA